jgi:tetrahydromethanopterin S-methyltransferase subunit E
MVLGDGLENVVTYVDDIVVHSACFEHQLHLDAVIGKLTIAGFTINAAFVNCRLSFLGHVISSEPLLPHQDRIKAILS